MIAALKTSLKRSGKEMAGDFLREAAVLLLIFGILDPFFKNQSLRPKVATEEAVLIAVFFAAGVVLEKWG